MQILPYIFNTMKWFGVWQPIEWSSEWQTNIYWTYTLIIIVLLSFNPLSNIVYLVKFVKDVDEIANNSFLFLTQVCTFYKVINILNRRLDIIGFTDSLTNGISKPNGPEEGRIQKEFDKWIKQITLWYYALVGITIICTYIVNYLNNVPQRTLPYDACFPFNHSTNVGYWVAYIYQYLAQFLFGFLCVSYDTLFCGLMGQACAQLRILQYRLKSMQNTIFQTIQNDQELRNTSDIEILEKRVLQQCVRHHQHIFIYAEMINETFGVVIFAQCVISTFVICCSIYLLSGVKPSSSEFASLIAYVMCMLVQLFLYCWYGNEVMLESMDVRDAVYAMDWTTLKVQTQKKLVLLMARSLEPIKITSASVIVLSLDTYKSLLKLSYSMYNLLERTSEQ